MKGPATSQEALRQIYRTTRGYCRGCRRKLAFAGYARANVRGAWDIEPAALEPACTACLSRPARRPRHSAPARLPTPGVARPVDCRHTVLGGLLGALVLGPWGALLGGLLGAEVDGGDGR